MDILKSNLHQNTDTSVFYYRFYQAEKERREENFLIFTKTKQL